MNAIDLFAGCGGLSKGFMDAGYEILLGVDNDQAALNTFKKNHNGWRYSVKCRFIEAKYF